MDQNNNIVQDSQVQPLSNSPAPQETIENSVNNTIPKWYSRFAAYLIDSLIFTLILFPLFFLIGFGSAAFLGSASEITLTILVALLVPILSSLYFAYFQSKEGMTWGMKFIGLKISQPSGELLTFQNALFRALLVTGVGSILSIIPFAGQLLSFIYVIVLIVTILTNKSNQGFHDRMFNAIYSKIDEKTTRAKWVLGCYCGCGLISLIIGLVALIIGFSAVGMSGFADQDFLNKLKQTPQPRMKENKNELKQELNKIQENPSNTEQEQEITSEEQASDSQEFQGMDFYTACMNANTDKNVDLDQYCVCAEEAYTEGLDLNGIVNKCKNLIKLNN